MLPHFLEDWRAERRLRRKASQFVAAIFADPDESDVRWLAERATDGDLDRARWELRYARRALGLLSSQRDALDDRTGSAVAREVTTAMASDPHIGAGMTRLAERQFNSRLRGYADAIAARTLGRSAAGRLGQALLAHSEASLPFDDESVGRGGELLSRYSAEANEELRRLFGAASLPENVPPSAAEAERRR